MERGKESTFLLWIWSFIFLFAPIQLPILEIKNTILIPFWQSLLASLFNREILIFSDSEGFLFLITAILIGAGISFLVLRKWIARHVDTIHQFLKRFLLACLFLIFIKYGIDKVMLLQFPRPEPNLMYTELRHLDKDILFWTSVGTSSLYNYLTGGVEIVAALFLLFRRTRRLGLFVLMLSTLYIVLVNFSFNIGVKMFSLILLGTLISLSWNSLTFLFTYFLGFGEEKEKKSRLYLPILKGILGLSLVGYLFLLNTENKITNALQGAYQTTEGNELKSLYINQQDYWIQEDSLGSISSFKILQQGSRTIQLEDENGQSVYWEFYEKDNDFILKRDHFKPQKFKKLDLAKANINQDSFAWVVR